MVETEEACRNGPRWPWAHVKVIAAEDGKRYADDFKDEVPSMCGVMWRERTDEIGCRARTELERHLNLRVHLILNVRVRRE